MKAVKVAALAYAALLAVMVWFGISIHVDSFGGTRGLSIGTDTAYCSVEFNHDGHGAGVDFWCQSGR